MHPSLWAGNSRQLSSLLPQFAWPVSPASAYHSWALRRVYNLMQAGCSQGRVWAHSSGQPPSPSSWPSQPCWSHSSSLLDGRVQGLSHKYQTFVRKPPFVTASVPHRVSHCSFVPCTPVPSFHQPGSSPAAFQGIEANAHQGLIVIESLRPPFELSKRAHSSSVLEWVDRLWKGPERQEQPAEAGDSQTRDQDDRNTGQVAGPSSRFEQATANSSQLTPERKQEVIPALRGRRAGRRAGRARSGLQTTSLSEDDSFRCEADAWTGATVPNAAGKEHKRQSKAPRKGPQRVHPDLEFKQCDGVPTWLKASKDVVEKQRQRRWGGVALVDTDILDMVSEEERRELEQRSAQRPFQRLNVSERVKAQREGLNNKRRGSAVGTPAVASDGLPAVSPVYPYILQPHQHRLDDRQIPHAAWAVLRKLRDAGFESYLAGGMVRDLLLGNTPKDIDIISTALPNQVRKAVPRTAVYGRRHRIAEVDVAGTKVEVSSFGTISSPEALVDDTCHERGTPAQRAAASREQLARHLRSRVAPIRRHLLDSALKRDLTINGLLYEPFSGVVYDFVGGTKDLNLRTIRTIIDAEASFVEDPARVLRAIRIAARTGFELSQETQEAVAEVGRSALLSLSKARVQLEVHVMLAYGSARRSVELLWRHGLLEILLPLQAEYLTAKGHPRRGAPQSPELLLDLLGALDSLTSPDAPCHGGLWVAILALPLAVARTNASPHVLLTLAKLIRSHRGSDRGWQEEWREAGAQLYNSLFEREEQRLGRPVPQAGEFRQAVIDQVKQWTLDSVPRGMSQTHLEACHSAAVERLAEQGNEVVRKMTMSHVDLIERLTRLRAVQDQSAVTRAHATRALVLFSLVAKRSLPEVVEYRKLLEEARRQSPGRRRLLILVPGKNTNELQLKEGRPTELADALEVIVGKAVAPTSLFQSNVLACQQGKFGEIQANLEKVVASFGTA